MAQLSYRFWGPTQVLFGAGQLDNLHTLPMPGKKAMVVISNGKSTRANGSLDRTLDQLRQAGVETLVFDRVGANPHQGGHRGGRLLCPRAWLRLRRGARRRLGHGLRQGHGALRPAA